MRNRFLFILLAVSIVAGCKKGDPLVDNFTCYLVEQSDIQGKTTFLLDENNRLVRNTVFNAGGGELFQTNLTYNANGQLARTTISRTGALATVIQYEYDNSGRLITERRFEDSDGNGTAEPAGYSRYTYDAQNRPATKTNFNNSNVAQTSESYTYDGRNNISRVNRFSFTNNQQTPAGFTDYLYDDKINPFKAFNLPSSLTEEYGANNVTVQSDKNATGQTISTSTFAYQYNNNRLPTQVVISRPSAAPVTVTYTYNCKGN